MRVRTAITTVLCLWLGVGVAVAAGTAGGDRDGAAPAPPPLDGATPASPRLDGHVVLLAALTPFGACDELLDHVQEHALEVVGPYGLGTGGVLWTEEAAEGVDTAAADATVGGSARDAPVPASGDADGFSGTNVQEAGVDEPDLVKTDGRVLYAAVDDRIRAVDVSGDSPVVLGELRLDGDTWGAQLLLAGDRLLVIGTAHRDVPGHPLPIEGDGGIGDVRLGILPAGTAATTVTLLDVSDPAAMTVLETLTVDGSSLSARVVDGLVRLVVRAEPTGLPFAYPEGGGLRAEEVATERNREVVRSSTVEDWLPYAIHVDAAGTRTEGTLVDCASVSRPREFAGLGTVDLVTIDPASGLQPVDVTAVLGGGDTISASTDRLYVATTRWADPGRPADTTDEATTEIHAFDITSAAARHTGSGAVPGHLLNQFAMSEHDGYLRVASTEGAPWGGGARPQESRVTVLAEEDDALVEVGSVGGLGVDERIYAVRFLGDVGYVVTFRQIDPLYTIDLRDPTAPRVRGELKIPGYSAYLHPLGDGLVLGVGQDATEDGRSLGAQVSLFDVADLDQPTRLATFPLGEGAMTDVEHDHRAFLHWPATNLAVVPVQRWQWDESGQEEDVEMAAVGLVADRQGIREVGRASHLLPPAAPEGRVGDAWEGAILRALVTGDRLVTLSHRGVLISDLETLAPRGFAAFGGR